MGKQLAPGHTAEDGRPAQLILYGPREICSFLTRVK